MASLEAGVHAHREQVQLAMWAVCLCAQKKDGCVEGRVCDGQHVLASAQPWTDRANRRQLLAETCVRRASH